MKTFTVTHRLSAQAKAEIERILYTHAKHKGSYFFKPDSTANGRRKAEELFKKANPDVVFKTDTDFIEVKMSYEQTCKNVYYSLTVLVNGFVSDIRAIKKLLK